MARRRVVILTWDPNSEGFWLVQDYFPKIIKLDQKIFPSLGYIRQCLGSVSIQTVPIPAHCQDGFLGAYWRRPEAYLRKDIRAGISSFSRIPEVESRVEKLRRDLENGDWEERYGDLRRLDSLDLGYRIVVAEVGET